MCVESVDPEMWSCIWAATLWCQWCCVKTAAGEQATLSNKALSSKLAQRSTCIHSKDFTVIRKQSHLPSKPKIPLLCSMASMLYISARHTWFSRRQGICCSVDCVVCVCVTVHRKTNFLVNVLWQYTILSLILIWSCTLQRCRFPGQGNKSSQDSP